jgi:hypothetical protein
VRIGSAVLTGSVRFGYKRKPSDGVGEKADQKRRPEFYMSDSAFLSEVEWDDLIYDIERREVIPIVGCGAITAPETGEKFTAWLGKKLAANLQVPDDKIRSPREVNEVIGAYYRGAHHGGQLPYDAIKSRIKRIISDNRLPPAQHLVDLARIKHFDLFLTTSYDFMLQSALEQVRTPSKIQPINIWNTNNVPELDLPENWHAAVLSSHYVVELK